MGESAVLVLAEHGHRVDLAPVLTSLPASTNLHRRAGILTCSLESRVSARHSTSLLRALHHSQHLQLQEDRVAVESVRVDMGENSVCAQCGKRFTTLKAFARRPDGRLLHYS